MTAFILTQLWWFMPLFVGLIYFAIGFLVCKYLISNEAISSVGGYWFYFFFWLPMFFFGVLISFFRWVSQFPKKLAESQLNQ